MFVVLLWPLQLPRTIASLKAFSRIKRGIEQEDNNNNNKKKGKREWTNSSTCRGAVPKPTQMDMIASFSLYLSPPLWLSAFLSLGLIRLHVEIEAIAEDS